MAEPQACTSLSSLVQNRDLREVIFKHLTTAELLCLRLTSKDVCSAHDSHAKILLRQECFVTPQEAQHQLERLLQRGCVPDSVWIETDDDSPPCKQQAYGEAFLRALAAASSASGPLPTHELIHDLEALSSTSPGLIAAAFPRLQSLTFLGTRHPKHVTWATLLPAVLEALLQRGAPLTELVVGANCPAGSIITELCAALSAATQLTDLDLSFDLAEPDHISAIANLRSLRSLSVASCNPELLPALLSPLTALTSLSLGNSSGPLPGEPLLALPGLASFKAGEATLDLHTLSQLTSLTSLSIYRLALPEGSAATELASGESLGLRLPPSLLDMEVRRVTTDALKALRASPVRPHTWRLGFVLDRGQHIDIHSGALTELGEAELCACAAFLAGRMDAESDVWIGTEDHALLRPVGGEAGVGPGRRNHTAWLEALGRAGVPRLGLDHISLSHQDLRTLSAHTGLKRLHFDKGTQYPCKGLLLLPRSPALEELVLDVGKWCGPNYEGPFKPPADVATVLQAILCMNPRLWVQLCCSGDVAEKVAERVYDLAMDVERELLGMSDPEPSRLEVELEVMGEEEDED